MVVYPEQRVRQRSTARELVEASGHTMAKVTRSMQLGARRLRCDFFEINRRLLTQKGKFDISHHIIVQVDDSREQEIVFIIDAMLGCGGSYYRLEGTCDEPRMDLRNASELGARPKKA